MQYRKEGNLVFQGKIINIQKYSIHDGPGIRTTVFLKGCPLNCWWCHNPESQCMEKEILYWENKCTSCGMCVKKCPNGAVEIKDGKLINHREKCAFCGKCIDFCINNAREISGKEYTVEEVMKEVEKDIVFYDESSGGVTFSGGEPFSQMNFLEALVDASKNKGIHVTIDTTGFTTEENLRKIASKADLFLYDLKFMDSEEHKKYTGVSNENIIENLKMLSSMHKEVYVRIPVIPGINDGENLRKSAEFLRNLNISKVNLLPYHKYGMDKYNRLGLEYKLKDTQEPTKDKMESILEMFKSYGLKAKIGG